MCEVFALSASAPVDIKLSLAELARHGGDTGIHADGWGVGFSAGRDAAIFREPQAAAFSPWVRCLQNHPTRSDTVIAHIRHATRGAISLANTQPFVRELGGQAYIFAHNGHLGDAVLSISTPSDRFTPIGETDSEAAFCGLMDDFAAIAELDIDNSTDRDLSVFAAFTRRMRDLGPANIILAVNGRLLVHADRRTQRTGAIEPPGLWMLQRSCSVAPAGEFAGGGVHLEGNALNVVLIASVPLTTEPWQPLERGAVLVLERGRIIKSESG
jgi:predicted glutamine amidotransferase